MFDNVDWTDAAQVTVIVGAITAIITALGKVAVDIIEAALDRNTSAVKEQTVKTEAADVLKMEATQRMLQANPNTEVITPANLPAAPQLQNPEVRDAAVKLIGTGDGGVVKPSEEELRRIIREEILGMVNEERPVTANPTRSIPQSP